MVNGVSLRVPLRTSAHTGAEAATPPNQRTRGACTAPFSGWSVSPKCLRGSAPNEGCVMAHGMRQEAMACGSAPVPHGGHGPER